MPGIACIPPSEPIELTETADLAALPAAARALFGSDAYGTLGWYRSCIDTALPATARPAFHLARQGGRILAVVPMRRDGGRLAALTTPYSCLWQPLLASDLDEASLRALGVALAGFWRRAGVVRLEALEAAASWRAPLLLGLREGGLCPLPFAHFGNWHLDVRGQSWAGYLASRPSVLRSAINRPTRRLIEGLGARYSVVTGGAGLETAIADYETIYAASWKQPEPFPAFTATLMRACAAEGTLRLGLLHLEGAPIAAQFWILRDGWASVQKLAHDESHKKLGPGTVLSALMLRDLLDREHVHMLDFGRGDDAYKKLWMEQRTQRVGVLLADPWTLGGAASIARHVFGTSKKASSSFLKKRSKKLLSLGTRLLHPSGANR